MSRAFEHQLDEMLDLLASLDDDDVLGLIEAWEVEDPGERRRAWTTASEHVRRSRLDRQLDRARTQVGRWAAAGGASFGGLGGALLGQPDAPSRLRMAAAPAFLDAVAALLAVDALDADQRAVLTRPWQSLDDARLDASGAQRGGKSH
jgi:hypothetical protein